MKSRITILIMLACLGARAQTNISVFEKVDIYKDHVAIIKSGTPEVIGHNGAGQLNVPIDAKGVVVLESGHSHIIALTASGNVIGWGYAAHGQLEVCENEGKAIAIAAGHSYSAVLYDDGTVKASGYPDMTKELAKLKDIKIIVRGDDNLLLCKDKNGKVYECGFRTPVISDEPISDEPIPEELK